ncbi:MAG: flagellar assembly protein FliH [Gammaproteobacteria bacterium]|nr:flagellar assembly protein FliH [Gammaproteobacteria bacterium]
MSSLITESVTEVAGWDLPVIGGKLKHQPPSAQELEKIRQQAHNDGFAEGKKAGLLAGQADIAQQVGHLEKLLHNLQSPLEDLDEQLSHEVAELSIAIARQIIRRELRQDHGQIIAIARDALAQLPSGVQKIRITLHPEDAQLIRAHLLEGGDQEYQIIESGAVQRGGCIVETADSRVDASVEKQINSVISVLFGEERQSDPDALEADIEDGDESGTESESPSED